MGNKFDPVMHTYFIDDIEVPGITSILPEQKFFISPERLFEVTEEGTTNHNLIKMYNDFGDTLGNPMLIEWDKWIKKQNFGKLLLFEKPLFSKKYMFAGTPDMIFENAKIELKRSFGLSKRHALQVAGQDILAIENNLPSSENWLVVIWDGENFKSRHVYNDKAIYTFHALIQKYYLDKQIQEYFQKNNERSIRN